jgi:NAD(P)-dependent dehydrogenase (short-subunit alcohol dehydrogenase family)
VTRELDETRELDGKVAIVTGAGQGVGMGIAIALARAGAHVELASRTGAKVYEIARCLQDEGRSAHGVKCDVTVPEQIRHCVDATFSDHRRFDILVNAADEARMLPLMSISEADVRVGWATGLLGTLRFMQASVPHMVKAGGGSIVNVASGSGLLALAGSAPYAFIEEAIRTLSRVAAVELGPQRIRVNTICPTAWSPSFEAWASDNPTMLAEVLEATPLQRIGDPVEDVGSAVVFLCGEASRYVTGTTLMIDGGHTYLR